MNYQQHRNILLEDYKAIYFVLPKNACSSMKTQIIEVLGMQVPGVPVEKRSVHDPEVFPYPFVPINALNGDCEKYFRFCLVRNPWDRLVSCFVNKIRAVGFQGKNFVDGVAVELLRCSPKFKAGMTFAEFVEVVCEISDANANNHFQSQVYLMTNTGGELLVNYIGKIEHLPHHLGRIRDLTSFPIDGFPHVNKSKRKPYQAFYNSELVEKVGKRYAADAKLLNYSFDQESSPDDLGFVDTELREKFSDPEHLTWVLKEKVRELRPLLDLGGGSTHALKRVVQDLQSQDGQKRLEAMENSFSWRITRPMRKVAALFEKKTPNS